MPERFGLGITNCRRASDVIHGVKVAEERGAEVAFVAEDVNCRDAFQLLSMAAGVTRRIRLATGVVNPYTRNPTSLAMAVATLDEVSGGRATLGLGASSPSLIEGEMGIASGSPVQVMREAVDIVGALLRGEHVTRVGKCFTYRDATLRATAVQPHVPVFLAAMGPQMLRLAGAVADGVLLNVGASTEYVRWAVTQVAQGAADAGRDLSEITIAAWLTAYITQDLDDGLQSAKEWLAGMLSIPRQGELLLDHSGIDASILLAIRQHVRAYPHAGDRKKAAAHVPDSVAERLTLVGDVAIVRQRMQEYRNAGVQLPVLGLPALTALFEAS